MKPVRSPHRIDFKRDKFGNPIDVTYYYKIEFAHIELINTLLKDCEHYLDSSDNKMLRKVLRTKEYSEKDIDRLKELRTMYIEDKYL
jgi:hypothetical protein